VNDDVYTKVTFVVLYHPFYGSFGIVSSTVFRDQSSNGTFRRVERNFLDFILDDGTDEPFDCINVTCPYEYFKCPSSGKCIPLEKVCDNFDDCPAINRTHGISEDETSHACSMSSLLQIFYFLCFFFLKILYLIISLI
jgi:hypothetical protein